MIGRDAGAQQVDVPLHEDARLARARRRLEDDVLRGIDGVPPRVGVWKKKGTGVFFGFGVRKNTPVPFFALVVERQAR